EVETPARELEVVRVAAECSDAGLRREHEPHVVVATIAIEKVLSAVVERDRLASSRLAGICGRVLALLCERRQLALARLVRRLRIETPRRGLHTRRHLLDVDQHVGHLCSAAQLVLAALRVETGVEQAFGTGRMLREAAR